MQNFITEFTKDERGASYSLAVAITLPFYVFLIVFGVEFSLMNLSHLSFAASGSAAYHAAKVWIPHRDVLLSEGSSLEQEVRNATVHAMIPYTPIPPVHSYSGDTDFSATLEAASLPASAIERFLKKRDAIAKALEVEISETGDRQSEVEIQLHYKAKIWFPFFAPIFANTELDGKPARLITQEVFVPLSEKQLAATTLPIPFSPRLAEQW